jgi:hypothetical protein
VDFHFHFGQTGVIPRQSEEGLFRTSHPQERPFGTRRGMWRSHRACSTAGLYCSLDDSSVACSIASLEMVTLVVESVGCH